MARSCRRVLTVALMLLQASSRPMSLDWLRTSVSAQNSVAVLLDAFVDRTKGGLKLMVLEPQAVVHTYNKFPNPQEVARFRERGAGTGGEAIEDLLHARASRGDFVCR
jgi:hypothetical protein